MILGVVLTEAALDFAPAVLQISYFLCCLGGAIDGEVTQIVKLRINVDFGGQAAQATFVRRQTDRVQRFGNGAVPYVQTSLSLQAPSTQVCR